MAKELPYFKFEPSEWENGLIQMCSRESKGLFIDIISIYWQRLGDLPYRFVLQKLCAGNANALQELINEEIIKVEDDKIVINFLDLQLKEFNHKSNKASESAKARWKKDAENQQVNANALQTESECNAIREEKIKEDKIIENNIVAKATPPEKINYESFIDYFNGTCTNFPKVLKITQKRKNAISVILKKYTKQQIADALKIANESEFLTGDNNRGWKADFDFLIKENTITKIIEGSYGKNKRNNTKGATGDELRTIIEAHFRD